LRISTFYENIFTKDITILLSATTILNAFIVENKSVIKY